MLLSIILKVLLFEAIALVIGLIGGFLLACFSPRVAKMVQRDMERKRIDKFEQTDAWKEVEQTAEWQTLYDLWLRSPWEAPHAILPSKEYHAALDKGITEYEHTGKFPLDEFMQVVYNELEKAKRVYESAA